MALVILKEYVIYEHGLVIAFSHSLINGQYGEGTGRFFTRGLETKPFLIFLICEA